MKNWSWQRKLALLPAVLFGGAVLVGLWPIFVLMALIGGFLTLTTYAITGEWWWKDE